MKENRLSVLLGTPSIRIIIPFINYFYWDEIVWKLVFMFEVIGAFARTTLTAPCTDNDFGLIWLKIVFLWKIMMPFPISRSVKIMFSESYYIKQLDEHRERCWKEQEIFQRWQSMVSGSDPARYRFLSAPWSYVKIWLKQHFNLFEHFFKIKIRMLASNCKHYLLSLWCGN
jgi:hypothetical protein